MREVERSWALPSQSPVAARKALRAVALSPVREGAWALGQVRERERERERCVGGQGAEQREQEAVVQIFLGH